MKLRHAPRSPFVRKVMVCAHEHGLVQRIELVPTAVSPIQANEPACAREPADEGAEPHHRRGEALFNSPVICEYLDSLAGGGRPFPASGAARWAASRQQALGDGILDALVLCRYETLRPEDKRWSGWTDGPIKKAYQDSPPSSAKLSPGTAIGLIAIGCMFGYLDFRFPQDGWRRRHPKLASWYQNFRNAPLDGSHQAAHGINEALSRECSWPGAKMLPGSRQGLPAGVPHACGAPRLFGRAFENSAGGPSSQSRR